jgi:hypothetical protein
MGDEKGRKLTRWFDALKSKVDQDRKLIKEFDSIVEERK